MCVIVSVRVTLTRFGIPKPGVNFSLVFLPDNRQIVPISSKTNVYALKPYGDYRLTVVSLRPTLASAVKVNTKIISITPNTITGTNTSNVCLIRADQRLNPVLY